MRLHAKPFRTARFSSEFHPPKSALGPTIRKALIYACSLESSPTTGNTDGGVSGVTVGRDGQFISFRAEETTAPCAYFGFLF
jgi:hypothetical protein